MSFTFPRFIRTRNVCTQVIRVLFWLALGAGALPAHAQSSQDPVYVFHTTLGDMRVQLYPDVTPKTVANFLSYVNSGAYNTSFIHRSVPGFVIQGGGYTTDANAQVYTIPANPPVNGEAHISNTRGTIAMALSTGPNSGTDQWFFNEADNSALLDGTNDGGPFTVFGKVADNASLAVMDKIAAVQTYNLGSPFDQIPLLNYQSGNSVVYSNLVVLSSITPDHAWTATAIAAGPDGKTRILWNKTDGTATVWTISADGSTASYSPNFGPLAGWSATHISVGPDNATHILWTNTDGRMTVWTLLAGGTTPTYGPVYGPLTGWTAVGIATGTSNNTHVLWVNTNGAMTLWTLPPGNGSPSYSPVFGPYAGWTAKAIATDFTSKVHVLWDNADGRMTLWTFTDNSSAPTYSPTFGPIAGWMATGVGVDAGGAAHVLWDNADGRMTLWTIPTTGSPSYGPVFGPYSGWSALGLSLGVSNDSHVLWDNINGKATPWTLNTAGQNVGTFPIYGPF